MANKLITNKDLEGDIFSQFKNDKERIKYMSRAYKDMGIAKSFAIFYGEEISQETKRNKSINTIINIELGGIYCGNVKEFTKNGIIFEFPGVKQEIICKENFNDCSTEINNYLLNHDNKLYFEVRQKTPTQYIVSVIGAYYKKWVDIVNSAIRYEEGLQVHIDSLVRGGYLCHTNITTLCELTGRNYTHSVFIPGSHIVLNIERDFEQWVGEDVIIVPQKFVEFRKNFATGETENSLVGSRKRVLQIIGQRKLEELYQKYRLVTTKGNVDPADYRSEEIEGTVTGMINSNNKTGIFVELDDMFITGFAPLDASELLDYKPGENVYVRITEFEVQEGKDPFIYNKKGSVVKSNTRVLFELS